MSQCRYCQKRPIELTLCDHDGTYSVCMQCSMQWGTKANAFKARAEVRALEWWFNQPEAVVAR